MSVQALTWVLEHSQAEHSARLVAISLANHAGTTGGDSYPAIGTIATEAKLGESTVRAAIEQLKQLGEIIEEGVSHLRTRRFRFPMHVPIEGADSGPPAESAGAQNLASEGADSGPEPSGAGERKRSAPAAAICGRVAEHVRALDAGASVDENSDEWHAAATALVEQDGRDVDQALDVISWLADEPFWSGRVLSPGDLRQHFGRIIAVRNGESKPKPGRQDVERSGRNDQARRAKAGHCCAEPGSPPLPAEAEWAKLAPEVREVVGQGMFERWFSGAHAHAGGDDELLLGVPEIVYGMVRDRFAPAINEVAKRRLEIVVCQETT